MLRNVAGRSAPPGPRAGNDSPKARSEVDPSGRPAREREAGAELPARLERAVRDLAGPAPAAAAWSDIGQILHEWGRHHEAIAAFERVGPVAEPSERASLAWANACESTGRTHERVAVLRAASQRLPSSSAIGLALAEAQIAIGEVDHAKRIVAGDTPLDVPPRMILQLEARLERRAGRLTDAESSARRSAQIDDRDPRKWLLLAGIQLDLGRIDDARSSLERAGRLAPDGDIALETSRLLAETLRRSSRFDEMIDSLAMALRRWPDPMLHFMLSEALLVSRILDQGWREFEFRLVASADGGERRRYNVPLWSGQPIAGKTVLVEAEQGVGDVVLFARFLPELDRLGANVVVVPREDMVDMTARFAGAHRVLRDGETIPPLDFWVPLASLALNLSATVDPRSFDRPYLRPDPVRSARWARSIPDRGRLRVGIVWAGNPSQPRDRFRSTSLEAWTPVLRVRNVDFYSLQKGAAEDQLEQLSADAGVTPLSREFGDLEDLVAAIDNLDLVVSVCTGPAHIAGAMGKRVWTIISEPPDLRWGVARTVSDWYPRMRLFRQASAGDWASAFGSAAAELQRLAENPGIDGDAAASGDRRSVMRTGASRSPDWPDDRVVETRDARLVVCPTTTDWSALVHYAEWQTARLEYARKWTARRSTVIEAGAGAGAHVVAIARQIGDDGRLFAYESDARSRCALAANVRRNGASCVCVMPRNLVGPGAFTAEQEAVDHLMLDRLDGLKINDGVDAAAIVEGSVDTLWRCRPWLILAQDDDAALAVLARRVREFGYRTWRMETRLWSPDNFNRRADDIFDGAMALTLVALPEESRLPEPGTGCVELR